MDFSNITDQDLKVAYDRAMAAGDMPNALMFDNELKRRLGERTPETTVTEQTLGGFYEGFAGLAGAPVDVVAAGLRKVGLDVGEKPVGGAESIKGLLDVMTPGGEAIPKALPQTAGQRIGRRAGESMGAAVPATVGMLAAAPAKVAATAPTAWNAFKQVLASMKGEALKAPAAFAATEAALTAGGGLAAGAVEEIFPDNPTAEMVAEVLGAAGTASALRGAQRLLAKKVTGPLTAQALNDEAGKLYDLQVQEGLSAQPAITTNIYDNVFQRADIHGIILPDGAVDPDLPKMKAVMSILKSYSDKGMTGANILRVRQIIKGRLNDAEGVEKNALRNVLREFDANTAEISPTIKVANSMYARAMKADQVEELMDLARTRVTTANFDMENSIRSEFRTLLRRIIKGHEIGWTPSEVEQIKQIVEGGSLENMMRFVGKFAPTGVLSTGLSGGLPFAAAMQVTGDPYVSGTVAGGVMGVGASGKAMVAALQKQNVDRLYQSITQGRTLTPDAAQRLKAALTAYLGSQAAGQAAQ